MMVLAGAAVVLSVAAATVPAHIPTRGVGRVQPPTPAVSYGANQVEAYLSAEQMEYIRPGFKVRLNGISNVAPGQKPVADVSYTDDMDQPLDYAGKVTPGALSISFILAVWDPDARQYTSYTTRTRNGVTNPSADQGGTWAHDGLGHSTYTFGTTLPATLDVTKTLTLGIYGRRTMTAIIGKDYYANNINYDFRPDGGAAAPTWDAMDVAATCNSCHDPLAAHGGTRRTVKNCVLCHQPQVPVDATTGNTFDFKVMIHKIHMGAELPSVQAGGHYGFGDDTDFSTVAYPQDIRNCTTCHQTDKPESHIWYDRPTRRTCGSCHDTVNWVTGENHAAGPALDDSACAACHLPEGELEFDISVKNAHIIPTKSAQLKGLKLEITDVTDTAPGSKPTVTYTLTNGDGSAIDPKSMNRLRFYIAGPATDYTGNVRQDAGQISTCSGATCSFTFTSPIPADATGTWVVYADAYRNVNLSPGPTAATREAVFNPMLSFPVTDAQAQPRRSVIDTGKCNTCHDVLGLHGGQRMNVDGCPICHAPNATATVEAGGANESIAQKWMIHKIHTGEELTRDYVIGDTSFHEVRYPGDRRNCEACHKAGTYGLPLPDGVLPTDTPRDYVPVWQPESASCLPCHDSKDAAAHAYVNTAPFGEACAACHGSGAEFDVAKVHAR